MRSKGKRIIKGMIFRFKEKVEILEVDHNKKKVTVKEVGTNEKTTMRIDLFKTMYEVEPCT